VSGAVKAGHKAGTDAYKADVTALGSVSGDVTASGDATVTAGESVSGKVHAKQGSATVTALKDVSGEVKAQQTVGVTAGQNVSGSLIKSNQAAVTVNAHQGVSTQKIVAGTHATVIATQDMTSQTIHAGKTADGTATVTALGAITTNSVKASQGATIFAGTTANVTNAKTTNGDITVTAVDAVQGSYNAAKDVFVYSFGNATGLTADAATGDATAFAAENLSGTVTGKKSASAFAIGNVSGTVTSPGTTSVFAGGNASGTMEGTNSVRGRKGVRNRFLTSGSSFRRREKNNR